MLSGLTFLFDIKSLENIYILYNLTLDIYNKGNNFFLEYV